MKCECCKKEYKDFYGAGRFCSQSCANTRKHTEETKQKLRSKRSNKKLQEKEISKICPKCKNSFLIKRKINKNNEEIINKKERKFCSRYCANSHIQTNEQNIKRQEKLKLPNKHIKCKICDNTFEIKGSSKKQICSIKCQNINRHLISKRAAEARKIKYSSEEWSFICKESYKNGINTIGGGRTKWYSYGKIKVQGTYELRACKIFDIWKNNNLIKDWEYTNDRYPYIGTDNKEHSYILDFKIINKDNSFYYIETKGFATEKDKLKWKAVRDKNIELKVWFLQEIEYFESLYLNQGSIP